MEKGKFKHIRAKLEKTQKELAELLGVSIKAIHSYEQGWRKIPHHVERQLLFLLSKKILGDEKQSKKCWDIIKCSDKMLKNCPAWEFDAGDLCWFINGTRCNGNTQNSWKDKMKVCKKCRVFRSIFGNEKDGSTNG